MRPQEEHHLPQWVPFQMSGTHDCAVVPMALLTVLSAAEAPEVITKEITNRKVALCWGIESCFFPLAKLKALFLGIIPSTCLNILVRSLFLDGSHLPLHLSLQPFSRCYPRLPLLNQPPRASFQGLQCGPVDWTPHFHCRGHRFHPWSGKFHMPCSMAGKFHMPCSSCGRKKEKNVKPSSFSPP